MHRVGGKEWELDAEPRGQGGPNLSPRFQSLPDRRCFSRLAFVLGSPLGHDRLGRRDRHPHEVEFLSQLSFDGFQAQEGNFTFVFGLPLLPLFDPPKEFSYLLMRIRMRYS